MMQIYDHRYEHQNWREETKKQNILPFLNNW